MSVGPKALNDLRQSGLNQASLTLNEKVATSTNTTAANNPNKLTSQTSKNTTVLVNKLSTNQPEELQESEFSSPSNNVTPSKNALAANTPVKLSPNNNNQRTTVAAPSPSNNKPSEELLESEFGLTEEEPAADTPATTSNTTATSEKTEKPEETETKEEAEQPEEKTEKPDETETKEEEGEPKGEEEEVKTAAELVAAAASQIVNKTAKKPTPSNVLKKTAKLLSSKSKQTQVMKKAMLMLNESGKLNVLTEEAGPSIVKLNTPANKAQLKIRSFRHSFEKHFAEMRKKTPLQIQQLKNELSGIEFAEIGNKNIIAGLLELVDDHDLKLLTIEKMLKHGDITINI